MTRSGMVALSLIAMLAHGCRKTDVDAGAASSVAKPSRPEHGRIEHDAGTAASTDETPATTTPLPFAPLTKGKTLRINGLDIAPLEVTVPSKFKFRMEDPGEDFGSRAHLKGPSGVDIEIFPPDDGKFLGLSEQRQVLEGGSHPDSIIRTQELSPGYVVIFEGRGVTTSEPDFGAFVSLPNLGVRCDAMSLRSLLDAELSVAVCLSLRSAKRVAIDLSALPPLGPLAQGKRVRIEGMKTVPLAMTVPPNFKFRLGPSVSPEGPDAEFRGPKDTMIVVRLPREWQSLALSEERERMLKEHPSATAIRADETSDGFLLIGLGSWTGGEYEYDVTVSKRRLNVICSATPQKKLSDAELLASACLSLHAASDDGP
jgi:hypothetical protein